MTNIAPLIVETARAIGMDPLDLATIISYETAGTFDPLKSGPTTQWGTHRGLIQFGEPQAQEYGVNWDDPIGSQLGPDGAVAEYFRRNGYQPGMGILDAYSIVNAGGPGRYNWTDANNGGAPGTVADKVNDQMAGHRAKAEQLLAGLGYSTGAPVEGTPILPERPTMAGILGSIGDTAEGLTPPQPQQQQMAPMQRPQFALGPLQDRTAPYRAFFQTLRA